MKVAFIVLVGVMYIVGMCLYRSALKDLRDIAELYDGILDAYTEQYNSFCDEQDKLCNLMNEYHELINAYQIPTIPFAPTMKDDDW